MAELAFTLEYDGPALESHEMDVKQLAPALFAVGELFQEMNRIQYPDNPDVTVNISAARDGSVKIDLTLVLAGTARLLASREATALVNLTSLLGGFGRLVEFVKVRAGRRIDKVEETGPGRVKVTLEDGVEVELDRTIKAFEENPTIRHRLSEVVSPVGSEGVDSVRIKHQEVTIGVEKEDVPAFVEPPPELDGASETVTDETREMALRIVGLWFRRGNKWKVTDGQSEFWAYILDEGFISDVLASRRAVTPHDVLRCEVRIHQQMDPSGSLHTDYEVNRVIEHIERPQLRLGEAEA